MSSSRPFPPPGQLMASGFNRDLLEDILTEIQARLFLYQLCPETGQCSKLECLICKWFKYSVVWSESVHMRIFNCDREKYHNCVNRLCCKGVCLDWCWNVHSILKHLDHRGAHTSSVDEKCRQISNLQRLQLLRKLPIGRWCQVILQW